MLLGKGRALGRVNYVLVALVVLWPCLLSCTQKTHKIKVKGQLDKSFEQWVDELERMPGGLKKNIDKYIGYKVRWQLYTMGGEKNTAYDAKQPLSPENWEKRQRLFSATLDKKADWGVVSRSKYPYEVSVLPGMGTDAVSAKWGGPLLQIDATVWGFDGGTGIFLTDYTIIREPESERAEAALREQAYAEAKAKVAARKQKKEAQRPSREKIDLLSETNISKYEKDPFVGTGKKIKMLKGKIGVPFDLGKGIRFTLGDQYQGLFTSKTGEKLQAIELDRDLGLYFSEGVCLAEDTTIGHCGRDGSMRIYYRRTNRTDAGKVHCKQVLRYEVRVPFLGAAIDPALLNQCQMGKTNCLDTLPSEQFECETNKDCSVTVADGLCCTVREPVAYNKAFNKQLREFRTEQCEEVRCIPMVDSVGWNRPQCYQNKCVLNPNYRDDDLGALCL